MSARTRPDGDAAAAATPSVFPAGFAQASHIGTCYAHALGNGRGTGRGHA